MDAKERQYRPGERVPGTEYVVIRLEAEGGHGALYLVRHHFLEKKIQMLKTLRAFSPSRDLIERLKREAQMLAAMDHPHIVSVTSGGLTDEKEPRPYFVMERLKGRSLAQILPEAPEGVGIDAALKLTIELCDALDYVHVRHGVVHRDVKPDNIFLHVTPRNGSITKILDFGVAHLMDLEKRYTKNNLFLGTPRYASPEQVMGDKPTAQTDLYAVGLVLYELLLGHGPFDDAQTFATVATAHVKLAPPGFPTNRRFPDGLEALVMSLLAKAPRDRPKSAEWLATQLRQIKRIAELAERMETEDLSQTDASPVQNALTGHRAQLTEAGAPPDVASTPALSDPTLPGPPLAVADTVALAATEPSASAIDRGAATHTLHANLPPSAGKDTQQLASRRDWLPVREGAGALPSRVAAGRPPERREEPRTRTNDAVALPLTTDAPSLRWAAALGVTLALGVVGVGVTIYARAGAATSAASDGDPPSLASAPIAAAKAAPAATSPATNAAPTPSANGARAAAAAGAASADEAATAPTATASRAQGSAPKSAAARLPASGL